MSDLTTPLQRGTAWRRLLPAAGALLAAAAVALSAYAAHASDGAAQARLQQAALMAFGHGIALAVLGLQPARAVVHGMLAAMLLGVLLFSGSLVLVHLLNWPTRLAPLGGGLMIVSWIGLAAVIASGRWRA